MIATTKRRQRREKEDKEEARKMKKDPKITIRQTPDCHSTRQCTCHDPSPLEASARTFIAPLRQHSRHSPVLEHRDSNHARKLFDRPSCQKTGNLNIVSQWKCQPVLMSHQARSLHSTHIGVFFEKIDGPGSWLNHQQTRALYFSTKSTQNTPMSTHLTQKAPSIFVHDLMFRL